MLTAAVKGRGWWMLGIALAMLLGGVWLVGPVFWARSWEAKWDGFRSEWEAKGEDFGIAGHLPPEVPEDENFARHPWVVKLTDKNPEVLARLEAMQVDKIDGIVGLPHPTGDPAGFEKGLREDPPLADRMRAHFAEFEPELAAFRAALARPSVATGPDTGKGFAMEAPWIGWSELGTVLMYRAAHAVVTGDETGFVADAEALIRLGNHLSHEPFVTGLLIGVGVDACVDALVNGALDREGLMGKARRRLARAMEGDRRPIGESLAATLRIERGLLLQEIDRIEAGARSFGDLPNSGLVPRGAWLQVFFARNRLAVCEDLQEHLLAPDGSVRKGVGLEDFPAYGAALDELFSDDDPMLAIAAMGMSSIEMLANRLQRIAEQRSRTISRLLPER